MKDSLVEQCLVILKKDEVKNEIKALLSPIINFIFHELNPYIYSLIIFIFLLFIINLSVLIILIFLLRNKNIFTPIKK